MGRPGSARALLAEVTWPAAANPEGGRLASTRYRIAVRGRLTKQLASTFEGLDLEPGIGQTALVGQIRDQSHLFGVLDLVRELGLDLLSVERTG